jgi:hypothetical protein
LKSLGQTLDETCINTFFDALVTAIATITHPITLTNPRGVIIQICGLSLVRSPSRPL